MPKRLKQRRIAFPKDQPLTFHGLADADGLESLLPFDEKQVPRLIMRASIYRHRHMTYFKVSVTEFLFDQVAGLMKKGKPGPALVVLRTQGKDIHVPHEFSNSWELIPEPRLDPFKHYGRRAQDWE